MKLEDQVISKVQSKKLKELGINAEALWYWVCPVSDRVLSSQAGICHKDWANQIIQENDGHWTDHEMFAAYSVAELGVLLPDIYAKMQWVSISNAGYNSKSINMEPPTCYSVHIGESMNSLDHEAFDQEMYPTEAQERAAYLIHLLENKLVTAEECNKRLTE